MTDLDAEHVAQLRHLERKARRYAAALGVRLDPARPRRRITSRADFEQRYATLHRNAYWLVDALGYPTT